MNLESFCCKVERWSAVMQVKPEVASLIFLDNLAVILFISGREGEELERTK